MAPRLRPGEPSIAARWPQAIASAMLPLLIEHLPRDPERLGLREVQMAG